MTVELAESTWERADIVIGADRLRSAVRATVLGRDHAPRYSGITCWRGVAHPDAALDARLPPGVSWARGSVFRGASAAGRHRLLVRHGARPRGPASARW